MAGLSSTWFGGWGWGKPYLLHPNYEMRLLSFAKTYYSSLLSVTFILRTLTPPASSYMQAQADMAAAQIKGKPEAVVEKIVAGKVEKYYSTVCLMEQAFVKDANLTMKDIISSKIGELGENIVVRRFTRFAVGEGEAAAAATEQA